MTETMSLAPGAWLVVRRTFSQEDYDRTAALTGDDNPIHVDPAFAATTRFGRTLAHGMLLYGIISGAIAQLLGERPHTQLGQRLRFPGPTYTGDSLIIRVEVVVVASARLEIAAVIIGPDGHPVCEGLTSVRLMEAS